MRKDEKKCLETMDSLHPEVVILEQSNGAIEPSALGTILQRPGTARVVALNIYHNCATVYERRCLVITNSEDLVNAIQTGRGTRESISPVRFGSARHPRAGAARAKSPPRPRIQRQRGEP